MIRSTVLSTSRWCKSFIEIMNTSVQLHSHFPSINFSSSKHFPNQIDVVWCGVVWCGVVWCGVVWCGVVWCGVVWYGVVWCGVVWSGVEWPNYL